MKVLVTGADGFVGRAVCAELARAGETVVAGTRGAVPVPHAHDARALGDLARPRDLDDLLEDIDAVVHLAARVHVAADSSPDPAAAYRELNVDATRRLGQAAARAGVRRLIFLSSVKVHGERTIGRPFVETDAPDPRGPYALSKLEAEQALAEISQAGLETVVLRPPLVYGPGVKANFLALLRLCDSALPLPLGAVSGNRRNLVYVDDLAGAIRVCLAHPHAAGRTYLVASGPALSTAQLARELRRALGRPERLLPVPPDALRLLARLAGRADAAGRLVDSLAVDAGRIASELGWRSGWSLAEGLKSTVDWYRGRRTAASPPGRPVRAAGSRVLPGRR